MVRSSLAVLTLAFLCGFSSGLAPAAAQELSDFERETHAKAFGEAGLTEELSPQNKLIESIEVVVIEPFDDRDPMPNFVNRLHVRSQDYVILQEIPLEVGTPYTERLANDSVQSLRSTLKFSLVLVVTAKGSTPDRVRVVVIVKDIWSLRLNWDVEFVKGRLNRLVLNPSEVNLFGTHATLGGLYLLEPDRVSVGGTFFKPQIGPSNIGLYLAGGAILERSSGEAEGNWGYFQYYEPFISSFDRWAWSAGMGFRNEVTRRYRGENLLTFDFENESGAVESMPEVFETDRLAGEYELTRSFGTSNKTNVSLGMEADRRRYRAPPELSNYSPEAQAAFERSVLPTSDSRLSPFAQVRARSTRFQRLLDVETLSLQEDLWLGHDTLLRVYPASRSLGSSRSLMGVEWAAGYSLPIANGLARALVRANIEVADHQQNDVEFEAGARVISPRLGFGRLHLDVLGLNRYRNYLNHPEYALGGENRLRGYEFSAFRGDRVVSLNAEYRTRPLELLGVHLGAVAFYDTGAAAPEPERFAFKHSVGLGCRLLFPQFDRTVFRVDWGLPVGDAQRGLPGGVMATFGQAFSLPVVDEPSVLDGLLAQ